MTPYEMMLEMKEHGDFMLDTKKLLGNKFEIYVQFSIGGFVTTPTSINPNLTQKYTDNIFSSCDDNLEQAISEVYTKWKKYQVPNTSKPDKTPSE